MPALFNPHVFLPLLALVLIIANFVSYMIYRITHTVTGGQARLQVWGTPRDGKMTYLIAGTLNQPHTAFRAVLPELLRDSGITMVKYQNTGFTPQQIALQISLDIDRHNWDATIYSISVGDQVARWLSLWYSPDIRTIAINPCSEPHFLKKPVRVVAYTAAVLLQIACNLLGWLSLIPWLPASGNWYSLQLLADQLDAIVDYGTPRCGCEVCPPSGMLLSSKDQFLDNAAIQETYPDVPYVGLIGATHGNTIQQGELYQSGLEILLNKLDFEEQDSDG